MTKKNRKTKSSKQTRYGIHDQLIFENGEWKTVKGFSPVSNKQPNAVCLKCVHLDGGFCHAIYTHTPYKIPIPLDEPIVCDLFEAIESDDTLQ